MIYSLLTLKPNQDFTLMQMATQFICQGVKIQLEIQSGKELWIQFDDGVKTLIKQDMPMSIAGVHFTLKVDEDKFTLFPQSDGIEIIGHIHHPDVYQVMQYNLRTCLEMITKVSELEQNEKQIGASKIEGNSTRAANLGYALLCQLYLLFHQDGLTKTEKTELTTAYHALISLAKQAEKVTAIELGLVQAAFTGQAPDVSLYSQYDAAKNYFYTPTLKNLVRSLSQQLMQEGAVLINYGLGASYFHDQKSISGHHEVMRITFDGSPASGVGKYRCTVYNSGYESDIVNSDKELVKGVKEYELALQDKAAATRFLQLAFERSMRGDQGISQPAFNSINSELKKYLGREIRSNQKSAQIRGNCTTMSTRLLLEEMLSPSVFKNLYSFVSNPANLNRLILSGPALPAKSMEAHVTGKATDRIQHLASKISSSRALSVSSRSKSIQELINKNDIGNLHAILEAELAKLERVSYLEARLDMKINYHLGGEKAGTLLHFAIKNQHYQLASICLALGMTGMEKDMAGYPALHLAILQGQDKMANMIIEKNQKNKTTAVLSTSANDGVTAIKLALECDRSVVVSSLIDAETDLSPAANDGHVIFNMIMEKALFDAEAAAYFPLLNKLIKNPSHNKIDPTIVNGLGQNAIQIFQGKILAEAQGGKSLDSSLVELLNNLCLLDSNDHAKRLRNDPQLMTLVCPHLTLDVFKEVFKGFVEGYNASSDKSLYNFSLIIPLLLAANTDKLELVLKQKIAGVGNEILICLFSLLELGHSSQLPTGKPYNFTVSCNAIKLVLQAIPISQENADELGDLLKKFYSDTEIADILQLATIRSRTRPESKESDPSVEIPPANYNEIKNTLLQLVKENENYKRDITEQFIERKKSYYRIGDVTRAVIKFLTGLNVTRDEASLQPRTTVPDVMWSFWNTVTGRRFTSASQFSASSESSSANQSSASSTSSSANQSSTSSTSSSSSMSIKPEGRK